jgi:hypothetical protein
MAITTIAGVNAALPGQAWMFQKTVASLFGGGWFSPWTFVGLPGQGVAPSSGLAGDIPTDATVGAPRFTNPASGNTYLARATATLGQSSSVSTVVAVYDRLWHNSGINVTVATAQTINSVALTRPDANGVNVEAWWEVYVIMGAGTPTVTLAYTDSGGNVRTDGSSGALATTMIVGRCGQFQLHAGDLGVKSIQTWTASATFTSGTIGLVMRRMVTMLAVRMGVPVPGDALACGLPRVYDDACLEVLLFPNTSNQFTGNIDCSLIQG